MAAKPKYYAVAVGHSPGIYREWYGPEGAEAQVTGFSGARYQGFPSLEAARQWLAQQGTANPRLFNETEETTRANHTTPTSTRQPTTGDGLHTPARRASGSEASRPPAPRAAKASRQQRNQAETKHQAPGQKRPGPAEDPHHSTGQASRLTRRPERSDGDAGVLVPELVSAALASGQVVVFTDGACTGNPGRGGWAAVLRFGERRKEISGGFAHTTNNRMELTACIEALRLLQRACKVTLFSDSRYVVQGIEKGWARRWRANHWMRNADEPAENPDLWAELLQLCEKHQVRLIWLRGHAGHPENERCDQLAVAAAHQADLPPDTAYKK